MTLAQLTRKKGGAVDEDVISATSVLSGENDEEENDEEKEQEEEEKEEEDDDKELQVPRDLEEVLQDEVLPSKLKDVWGGKITKYLDEEDGLRKWTCGFCGEVRKGWNATKALGHLIGGPAMSRVVRRLNHKGSSCILILSRGRSSQNRTS